MVEPHHPIRLPRLRIGIGVALVCVIVVAGGAVAQSEPDTAATETAGPDVRSVAATTRDLRTTTTATGTLERTERRTIGHGGTVTPVAAVPETGDASQGAGASGDTAAPTETAAASDALPVDDPAMTLASYTLSEGPSDPAAEEPPPCGPDGPLGHPVEEPTCPPEVPSEVPSEPGAPSEEPSEPGAPSEVPSEPGVPSEVPSEPGVPSEEPSEPGVPGQPGGPGQPAPGQQPPFVPPAPEGVPGGRQPAMPGGGAQVQPGAMPGGQQPAGVPRPGGVVPASGQAVPAGAGPQPGADEQVPSAVLTALADLGTDVARGTVLYDADAEPVVALMGSVPLWRTLETGVDNGPDVRQLERNLEALGYGDDLTVDQEFTDATAAAVEAWEDDLGRDDPDGIVEPGDIVYLTDPGTIIAHEAKVGETVVAGTPVLTISGDAQLVSASVPVEEIDAWSPGTAVELSWDDDGDTTTGAVTGVGRDVTTSSGGDPTVELTVALDEHTARHPNQSEVTVSFTAEHRPGAVAVPVAAVVAGPGGQPAVRVVDGGTERLVDVTTGLVDDGWIEVRDGLDVGDVVRLPG